MNYDAVTLTSKPHFTMTEPTLNYVSCPDPVLPGGSEEPAGRHRMAWWQWGDADAPHAVVCVHGISRQGRDFDTLARALVARAKGRVRVVCADVVGRGQSDWLRHPLGYQVSTYGADHLRLLAALQDHAPITALDWVGTSMGGLIGLFIAGQQALGLPIPVRRLVLNDVGPVIQWEALQRIRQYIGNTGRFDTLEAAAQSLWQLSTSFGPHTPEQWLALSRPMLKPLPQGGYTLHYDPAIAVPLAGVTQDMAIQGEAMLWQLYEQVRADTLLLRGKQSDLLSLPTAQRMTQTGPKARLVEFEGVGHAPTLLADDQVAVVCDFLLR